MPTANTKPTATAYEPVQRRITLWFGLFGGAGAWTTHLMLAYAISEFGCVGGAIVTRYMGMSAVVCLLSVVTVLTTTAAIAATVVAFRIRSSLRPAEDSDRLAGGERYAARVGVVCGALFTFIILFESIPLLFFWHGC